MEKISFENDVTKLNKDMFDMFQNNIEEAINDIEKVINAKRMIITTTAAITQNTNYTVPQKYYVGKNDMQIFFEGCLLVKDVNYIEVGTSGGESTIIQFKDWSVPTASKLEFLYR